ncbi:MAG: helix-turn-helix transcriptional regulator [Lachnospiraceae bacterium]|nr:helix-turn-helix transcriptional regulator [Lachnospiraceae bacterium]
MNRKSLFYALFIGLIYVWTGSVFIAIIYRLYDFCEVNTVTLISEALLYICQAAGALASALLCKKRGKQGSIPMLLAALLLTAILSLVSLLMPLGNGVIVISCFSNLGIGFLLGESILSLVSFVPKNSRCISIGLAYAIGSVGSYLLSLIYEEGLSAPQMIYFFMGFMIITVFMCYPLRFFRVPIAMEQAENLARKTIVLACAVPFLSYLVYSMGYYFGTMVYVAGIDISLTRAFYAISLIVAGILNDKNRKLGGFASFLILVFPFISLSLQNTNGFAMTLCILSYLALGFLSIYRVALFTDMASKGTSFLYLAPLGVVMGPLGNAGGTSIGLALDDNQILLTLLVGGMFMVTGIVFFLLNQNLYRPKTELAAVEKTPVVEKSPEEKFFAFRVAYGLNDNQTEVFKRIMEGHSNAKISEEMFLAESTIKYHVKNILKATGATDRKSLLALYHNFVP